MLVINSVGLIIVVASGVLFDCMFGFSGVRVGLVIVLFTGFVMLLLLLVFTCLYF